MKTKLTKKQIIKRVVEYSAVALIVAAVVLIYYFVAKHTLDDIIKFNKAEDYDGLRKYMQNFGVAGAGVIALLEMLQMIVIFIPAEFVQIAAGLSYPIYFALPICMLGVFLGSSVIFVIVRLLHIRLDIFERRTGKIQKFVSQINQNASMTVIMYILFIMPMIPFGAIAYFASSSKIKYPRYALVCTTGVIPSILSSYALGYVILNVWGKGTKTFILAVVLVVIAMVLLLAVLAYAVKRLFFVKTYKKPNFILYHLLYPFVSLYFACKLRVKKINVAKRIKKPCVILGRHTSFFDFWYMVKSIYPKRPAVVGNRYYYDYKKTRSFTRTMGVIPKRLFAADIDTMRQIYAAKKQKLPIFICPEGRLSSDGAGMGILESTERLIKKLGLDVYFFGTVGGYYARPKWRNKTVRHRVEVTLKLMLSAEDVQNRSVDEIRQTIDGYFRFDECTEYAESSSKKKCDANVEGLENILYRCKHCGAEYTLLSKDNALTCSSCGETFTFDRNYKTQDGETVSDWYRGIKDILRQTSAQPFALSEKAEIALFDEKKKQMVKCGSGVCTLTEQGFEFVGEENGSPVEYRHTPKTLSALAFGCNEEFEFYADNKLIYFYPENSRCVVKWSALWDVMVEKYNEEKSAAEATTDGERKALAAATVAGNGGATNAEQQSETPQQKQEP
ncbi:MAG: VTT domain-containing protein [Corallococcus sp.]|nr:VTT domain-containing protein [Corallococcus sp.]MCM1358920.1 VTT domain-containing protein [Corallococcus sp.]MCM1394908.1 VTT domain-containing protein [Corallococcus sp.]